MMRPSCSVIEQKVHPPKQPRMMLIENRIMSHAGILASTSDGSGLRWNGEAKNTSISAVVSGNGGGLSQTSRSPLSLIHISRHPA